MHIAVLIMNCFQAVCCGTAEEIVAEAKRHIGRAKWSYGSSYGTGRNTHKGNQFVHDVLEKVGANPPRRWSWRTFWWAPIGAGEWGNPKSKYLTNYRFWIRCNGGRRKGDLISNGQHVGIITGNKLTTSAASIGLGNRVVENDWGFRTIGSGSYNAITACWRYIC